MIDLETLAASCATMADEIVARGSSDTFRYDADGVLEFGDNPEYYSPLSSAVSRSAFPETAREYGYTREYLERAERRLLGLASSGTARSTASSHPSATAARTMTASASTRSTSTRSCCAPAPPRPTRADVRRSRAPSRATGS